LKLLLILLKLLADYNFSFVYKKLVANGLSTRVLDSLLSNLPKDYVKLIGSQLDLVENFCAYCGSSSLINSNGGFMVCADCGSTVGGVIDESLPRAYSLDEINHRRHNAPVYSHKGNARTDISKNYSGFKDCRGVFINPSLAPLFNRIKRYNLQHDVSVVSLNISDVYFKLFDYHSSDVIKTAKRIFNYCQTKGLLKGHSVKGFVLASLNATFKVINCDYPESLDQLINWANLSLEDDDLLDKKSVYFHCKALNNSTVLKELGYTIKNVGNNIISPKRVGSLFNLSDKQTSLLNSYISSDKIKKQCGKDPKGWYAAFVYLICLHDCFWSQDEVADKMKITPVTLRKRVRDIKRLFPGYFV